jgi:hypothetical protein
VDFWTTIARWISRRHVGAAKPSQTVLVRRGHFERRYAPWEGNDVGATIPTGGKPWRAIWTPTTEWMEVPGVFESEIDQSFDNQGIASLNLTVENTRLEEIGDGLFHRIGRAFLSPWRGYRKPDQPANEWTGVFGKRAQVAVLQGYGSDQEFPTFVGLLNDVDLTSHPDRATATGRDFGQVLTTERLYGYSKDKGLPDPITFMDRRKADDTKHVGSKASASSEVPGHPARYVLDSNGREAAWWSDGHDDPDHTEYVQIHMPRGRYLSFYMEPAFAGMEVYISVFARDRVPADADHRYYGPTKLAQVDDQDVEQGWIDLGHGTVPGTDTPYMKKATADGSGKFWTFGHKLELGEDSVLRVHFRKLGKSTSVAGPRRRVYRAGVRRLFAVSRKQKPEVKKNRVILVDDLADIVKVVLRWAGFTEWEIEDTGVSLKEPMKFNQANYLIDPINKITEMTNYVFFLKPPETLDNDSIGIPVFRYNRVLDTAQESIDTAPTVRDDQLLTALSIKETDAIMPSIVRVQGTFATKKQGGVMLASQASAGRRFYGSYVPRWHRDHSEAGVLQHVTHFEDLYTSNFECKVAATLTALAAALKMRGATFEMPAMPLFHLDTKVAVWDDGTSTHARIYIAQRTVNFRSGENAAFTMSIGGAVLDTPELDGVIEDLYATLANGDPGAPAKPPAGDVPVAIGGHLQPRMLIPGGSAEDA